MLHSCLRLAAIGVVTIICALPTSASIVFQHTYLAPSDTSTDVSCTSCGGSSRIWDQFVLAADTTIARIEARLYFSAPQSVEYSVWNSSRTVKIYSQSFLYSSLDLTSINNPPDRFFDVTVLPAGFDLTSGTYQLSIYSSAGTLGWSQVLATVDGHSYQSNGSVVGKDLAFRLRDDAAGAGSAPEPATFLLVATALLVLGVGMKSDRGEKAAATAGGASAFAVPGATV